MESGDVFICRGCLNPVTSAGRTNVDIGATAKLELVDKFCYLGDMLGDMLSVYGDVDAVWRPDFELIGTSSGSWYQTWNWVTFCVPVTRESSDPETQLTR